jgi:SAM-dependent methyltransferase
LKSAWDASYRKFQNTLFYPSEGVVAFVNRNIRRRIGPSEYTKRFDTKPRVLDIGSGAGRHLKYLWENGFYPIGVELSEVACAQAESFMRYAGASADDFEVHCCDSASLPIPVGTLDYAVSTAVFDSMTIDQARATADAVWQRLKPGALLYVDLISDVTQRTGAMLSSREFVIDEEHERGTVQTFFNAELAGSVFRKFTPVSLQLSQVLSEDGHVISGRWMTTWRK